jgi:hypothetical protein
MKNSSAAWLEFLDFDPINKKASPKTARLIIFLWARIPPGAVLAR